jgi:hypothetical protein
VIVVLVVLAMLVIALLIVLGTARSSLTSTQAKLEATEARLEAATRDAEAAAADAAEATARAAEERERAESLERERAALAEQLSAAQAAAEEAARELCERLASLEQQLAETERARSGALDALGVWALESVRLDRLWRDQVAAGTAEPSPLVSTTDPARAAVEIHAAALRESSGTPVDVQWTVSEPVAPVPGARLVRAVEELLAVGRAADAVTLQVDGGPGAISVTLETDPPISMPSHLAAALTAAGLEVTEGAEGTGAVSARLAWPPDSPAWEG